MPGGGEPMVSARGLVLAYGDHVALEASSFDIPAGRVTAIIGPNGSGKSTLLHAVAGLIAPAEGEVRMATDGPRHRLIAYVPQSTRVNEAMPVTVREVVAMGRYARLGPFRRFTGEDHRVCTRVMERLAISHLAGRHLGELSGGERQRVFVAQGLAQEAEVLLLDEAVTGLDLVSRETILEVTAEQRESGTTVVLATHDLSDAAEADLVLLLSGRVVASGRPSEVLTPAALQEAYGTPLLALEAGHSLLDDPHHTPASRRHVHFDRTGHADHRREG